MMMKVSEFGSSSFLLLFLVLISCVDDENAPTDHLILCQYEKVSRVKNKWKCVLKDGVVNINGRDYMFSRATGDFEW